MQTVTVAKAACPAQISSATLIGETRSGLSSVYGIGIAIERNGLGAEPSIQLEGLHLYIRDDVGNETWVYVPPHEVSEWVHQGNHFDYFSFGWRHASRFDVSIADVSIAGRGQVTCGGAWLAGSVIQGQSLDAPSSWDAWLQVAHPPVDLAAFHPATILDAAEVTVPRGGPDNADCHIVIIVDGSSHASGFSIQQSSGYTPYDRDCIDAAKRSSYRAATFNNAAINSTVIVDWWYATISD